jgi:periplasmic divalent cation tolerance protein
LNSSYILVLVTTKDHSEAEKISLTLLDEKLIACANLITPVVSCFLWQGKVERAHECLVVMKSRVDLFEALAARVRGLHSYEVPEVLALPIVAGSMSYLDWLDNSLKK